MVNLQSLPGDHRLCHDQLCLQHDSVGTDISHQISYRHLYATTISRRCGSRTSGLRLHRPKPASIGKGRLETKEFFLVRVCEREADFDIFHEFRLESV